MQLLDFYLRIEDLFIEEVLALVDYVKSGLRQEGLAKVNSSASLVSLACMFGELRLKKPV